MKNALPKIRIEHLIKIYGEKPHTALKLFRSGKTRDFIRQATGHVLGVADVSLTVNCRGIVRGDGVIRFGKINPGTLH